MRPFKSTDNSAKIPFLEIPRIRSLRIRTKLLLALIPSIILIMVMTGFVTNWFSSRFLNEAIERNVRLQTLTSAHELEMFLNHCKEDILFLRERRITKAELFDFWRTRQKIRGWGYAGVAYLSDNDEESIYLVSQRGDVAEISSSDIPLVRPEPRNSVQELKLQGLDYVWITPVIEGTYHLSPSDGIDQNISKKVIRLMTFAVGEDGSAAGLIVLAVSAFQLRDILSLFHSPQSPFLAFVRSPELRYSFLFDTDGWTWFQSEEATARNKELSTQTARSGFSGTFGKPGLPRAFKPYQEYQNYWQMVAEVKEGKNGLTLIKQNTAEHLSMTDTCYMGYAPVRFYPGNDHDPIIYAGVAYADRSRLGTWAGYRHIDVMFIITLFTTVIISLLVFVLSRALTRPIFNLAKAMNRIQESGTLEEIQIRDSDYETGLLRYSINKLISTVKMQMEEIQAKDERIMQSANREASQLKDDIRMLKMHFLDRHIDEIVGLCPTVESLKADIVKAATVDADVLIMGQTGTGKQLAAEAVHKNSSRRDRALISINCGALDESLLMDELFGHVKGAFTEAKTDRKGAFVTAQGGTLFLDEISSASPKVQQALLRAIETKKVAPLGSDTELSVDVRIIAASNEELSALVDEGRFRADLYYRLNVITIRTPSLKDHIEDIPILADHFLREAGDKMNKEYIGISRGALEELKLYDWPGNVRELKNCLTRAVAMAEGSLVQVEDLQLTPLNSTCPTTPPDSAASAFTPPLEHGVAENICPELLGELNERQQKAYEWLLKQGEISRSEYQEIIGKWLPRRTAQHDLQGMVKKGIVTKIGRGPSTSYKLIRKS